MRQLDELAAYAATNHLHGSDRFKRTSILKPLDFIFVELDRNANPGDRDLVRAGVKGLIFDHLERIAPPNYKPGQRKREQVNHYVDLFFDGVLAEGHQDDVNRLLQREKLLRSAYLTYYRAALPQRVGTPMTQGAPSGVTCVDDPGDEQQEEEQNADA